MSRRKPAAKRSKKAEAPTSPAPNPEHAVMLVTGSPFDGGSGIRKDATVGDVVNMLFWSATEDAERDDDFMRRLVASVRDDLTVLGLAAEHEHVEETARIAERLAHRLRFGQWLADRMAEAKAAEAANVEGAS